MADIKERHKLYNVHVINFQKKAPLQCYMLIILYNQNKIRKRQQIDANLYAEISGRHESLLLELQRTKMIYGSCVTYNSTFCCIVNDRSEKYSREARREESDESIVGSSVYKRLNIGGTVRVGT